MPEHNFHKLTANIVAVALEKLPILYTPTYFCTIQCVCMSVCLSVCLSVCMYVCMYAVCAE